MYFSDLLLIAKWWLLFFIIGTLFLPLTTAIFSKFFDRGYIFSKIIGVIFISYFVFVLGILKILPFEKLTIFLVITIFLLINLFFIKVKVRPWLRLNFKMGWKIFLFEEILFLSTLIFWSYVRSFQPDIHGLEKYMDFGFINSILRSSYFPPKDMWFTPFSINYYYFGHLVTAVLTKLSGIPSSITYNLMLSTIFAFTFTGAFSIGANLMKVGNTKRGVAQVEGLPTARTELFRRNTFEGALAGGKPATGPRAIIAGFLTAFLVSLGGNLHTIYTLFKPYINDNPVPFWQLVFSPNTFPNSYWYPNATRFIYNTIHEFPLYSFVVSDLHGHVLDIPIVLLTIAILLSLIQNAKFKVQNHNLKFKIFNFELQLYALRFTLYALLLAFLLAVMYMTNVWDGLIYALLTLTVFVYLASRSKNYTLYAILYTLIIVGFFLFSLPFNLNFKPFVSGIGVLCAPAFLTNLEKIGPFLFEVDHCQRSPLWQLAILYGFFYFWVITFFLMFIKKKNSNNKARNPKQYQNPNVQNTKRFGNLIFKNLNLFRVSSFEFRISKSTDIFVLILILISTLLIIIPEFIYIKDIYPAHYRANTMFKLVYQAFIMLSIASGYIIVRTISNLKHQILFFLFSILFFILVMIYPYFAINSYYGNLQIYKGLDGLSYLKTLYPTDYQAVLWINKNIKGQPVILEAQGDSYTDYARISANTGLPTVLGWTVHEWLWRGSYDIPAPRITEIKTLYETSDINVIKRLIKKYHLSLIFIGDLERQKYPELKEEKFETLGKIIYRNGQTRIYRINPVVF